MKKRLQFEFQSKEKQNLWNVSQSLTYLGSHQDEIASQIEENGISDYIYSRLQSDGYDILTLPI